MGSCASKPTAATAQTKAPVRRLSRKATHLQWASPGAESPLATNLELSSPLSPMYTDGSLYTVDDRVPTPTEFPDTATATFDSEYEALCATSCASHEWRRHSLSDWTPPSSPASDSLAPRSHTHPYRDSTFESLDYAIEECVVATPRGTGSHNNCSVNSNGPQQDEKGHECLPHRNDVATPENG